MDGSPRAPAPEGDVALQTRRAVKRFAAAFAVLALAAVLGAIAIVDAERDALRTIGEGRVAFARLGASQIRLAAATASAGVRAVAAQPALTEMLQRHDTDGARGMFREVQRNALFMDALVMIDATGAIVASHPEAVGDAIGAEGARLDEGRLALARFDSNPVILVRAAMPDGAGSIVGALSIARMVESVDAARFGRTGAETIVTRAGRVLASSDPERRHHDIASAELLATLGAGRTGFADYFSPTFRRMEVVAVAPVPDTPLVFMISQSRDETLGGLRWLRAMLALLALGLLVAAVLLVLRGVVERNRSVRTIAESRRRYRELVEMSTGLICEHDLDGRLLMVNPAAAERLGYPRAELEGQPLERFMPERHRPDFATYLARIAANGEDRGVLTLLSRDGHRRIWQYHNRLCREEGRAPYVIGHADDVTERLRLEASLREQGWRDALTGVHNRRYLERFERDAPRDAIWGCIVVDLDHFKQINDTEGHQRGDEVLQEVARFLGQHARVGDAVVRMGGDEFLILLPDDGAVALEAVAARLVAAARTGAPCGLSIGRAARFGAESLRETIDRADRQLYAVRSAQRRTDRRHSAA